MTGQSPDPNFIFDPGAPVRRVTDEAILASLRQLVLECGDKPPTTLDFDRWPRRPCIAATVSKRFGRWGCALELIGVRAGRWQRDYDPLQLMDNLEAVWREVGYPPGRRRLGKHGAGISESPYKKIWGSVKNACMQLSRFKRGEITEAELIGQQATSSRRTIALKVRWDVLKRDHYTCLRCGRHPPDCELNVDHVVPLAAGGNNDPANLQTLCFDCNQGKKARPE
jgi:5-methylcytosine-specific restriction endonuclease McrA